MPARPVFSGSSCAETSVAAIFLGPTLSRPFPEGQHPGALRACLRRQRRHSYQPRATPWVCRPQTILSAESATHCAEGLTRLQTPRRDLSWSNPMNPMRQAVGLQQNKTARKPRALPWAGINQAFGLRATDRISGRRPIEPAPARDSRRRLGSGSNPAQHPAAGGLSL